MIVRNFLCQVRRRCTVLLSVAYFFVEDLEGLLALNGFGEKYITFEQYRGGSAVSYALMHNELPGVNHHLWQARKYVDHSTASVLLIVLLGSEKDITTDRFLA